jgi:Cof subfamily protein (haloacid dehalogenase superfamily)
VPPTNPGEELGAALLRRFPDPLPSDDPALAAAPLDCALMCALLGGERPRVAHVLGVVRAAEELAGQLPDADRLRRPLRTAALFHDIGRVPALRRTGFPPLDSAIYLAHRGAPTAIFHAVLYHSGAAEVAAATPTWAAHYAALGSAPPPLTDALSFADLRTAVDGGWATVSERAHELAHPHHLPLDDLLPSLRAVQNRVLQQIAAATPHPLPWLFVDIDNTLLPGGTRVSAANAAALARYRAAGGSISLATGKHPAAFTALAAQLDLPGPHIAGNGTLIVTEDGAEQLAALGDTSASLVEHLRATGVPHATYTPAGVVATSPHTTAEQIGELTVVGELEPAAGDTPPGDQVLKILCFVPVDAVDLDTRLRAAAAGFGVGCTRTAPGLLELIPAGHGKNTAMETILRRHHWPSFHSIAIGDSENDLPLLRRAGRAVAVANATPAVQAAADILTASAADDGVAWYVESLLGELFRM